MTRSFFIGALLLACAAQPETKDVEMSNREIVRKLYEDCINSGDMALLPDLVSEDFVGANGERGPAGFRQTIISLRTAFPDIHFTIEELMADGDKVAARWKWHGTHRAAFRGLAPTQKSITTTAIVIYQFKHDKIVKNWLESDRLGVLQQMGVISSEIGKPSTGE